MKFKDFFSFSSSSESDQTECDSDDNFAESHFFWSGPGFPSEGISGDDYSEDLIEDEQRGHRHLFRFGVDPFHDDLFSVMDRFMKGFALGQSHSFPSIPESFCDQHQSRSGSSQHRSLRDQVLKQPEESLPSDDNFPEKDLPPHDKNLFTPGFHLPGDNFDSMIREFFGRPFFAPFLEDPLKKEDTDLDSDVRDQGVDALLDSDEFPSKRNRIAPRGHFAFHGTQQSTSIVTRSDGSSEKRVTQRDSDGNEETTIIRRTPDGKEHVTVERRRSDGSVESSSHDSSDCRSHALKRPSNDDNTGSSFRIFSGLERFLNDLFTK